MMKYFKLCLMTSALLAFSGVVFAGQGPIEINLGSVVAKAGGKSPVQVSLQPIRGYPESQWNINCSIPNQGNTNVIMQFGIKMASYAAWPSARLNEKTMAIMGNPQGTLNPGANTFLLEGVDNQKFNLLYFTNFDNSQNITVQCSATLSTNSK